MAACCNNNILGALQCVADGGMSTACFTPALTAAMDTTTSQCIITNAACGMGDGGDAGGHDGDAGTPADTGTPTDTGTTSDAPPG
jgi:hypothetical protein